MDTTELVKPLIALFAGGGLVKVFDMMLNKRGNDIKTLRGIIETMDLRITRQDVHISKQDKRITELEKTVTIKDRIIIDYEQQNTRYERSFNKGDGCDCKPCPIMEMFNKLTKDDLG